MGHYDPAHDAILVSPTFDVASTPRFVIEYIVYYLMLRRLYPMQNVGGRRREPVEFAAADKAFEARQAAKKFLRTM